MSAPPDAAMPRMILHVYIAAVCFVSLACLALALGIVAYSAVAVVDPSFTMHPMSLPPPEPPFAFVPAPIDGSGAIGAPTLRIPLSDEETARRRTAAVEFATHAEFATARQSLLRWSIVVAIAGALFLAHWRILRRARTCAN
jgi:hypothetical protein